MTGDSIITDEMKAQIGVESGPSTYEIERSSIRRWAEAIGDTNPLYHDEEYAKSKGYRSIIAPPGFVGQYAFAVTPSSSVDSSSSAGASNSAYRGVASPFSRNLNGGNEYEILKTVQAGDTLKMTTMIADLREREGRMGKMLFVITETTFKNQDGEIVAKARSTGISY